MALTLLSRPSRSASHGEPAILSSLASVRAILDSLQVNVFVADPQLRLVYLNGAARRTVETIDADLRSAFRVGSDELLGGSIHRFHRDPRHVQRILDDRSNFPHEATFSFGEVTLHTVIDAVPAPDGSVQGFVVAWDDVSEARRVATASRHLADEVAAASAQLMGASHELRSNAVEASAQASTVAGATEQMSASIRGVADGAAGTAQAARTAVETVGSSGVVLDRLTASAAEVGGIVRLITEIAEQTNLLALNAAIEAARAGEHGRGFAVVAKEVKELSRETAVAAEQIATIIRQLMADCETAAASLHEVGDRITDIDAQAAEIAGAVDEQTTVTSEIARNITSVASGADATSGVVDEIVDAASQLATMSDQLRSLIHTD